MKRIYEKVESSAGSLVALFSVLTIIAFPFIVFAAWLTHVIVTIQHHEWLLLVAGAIFFPIGIVHGGGLWFGLWSA